MRLIPEYIGDVKIVSERKVFEKFQKAKPDWLGFHSYGLKQHLFKREGEIDFLLIGPPGIFVIEVKGGSVRRQGGIWQFGTQRKYRKRESPFKQAQSALYSLRGNLERDYDPAIKKYVFGYGVIFPDITFEITSPEWSTETVADRRDMDDLNPYLERLSNYWHKVAPGPPLTQADIRKLLIHLRGDFEPMTSLDWQNTSEAAIAQLTDEQIKFLDAASSNPRILISGRAGTGKTVLASHQFQKNQEKQISTLFLCFNSLLAASLGRQLKTNVYTLHGFIRQTLGISTQAIDTFGNKDWLFRVEFPRQFIKKEIEKYDYLIVDEAQDVVSRHYLGVLNHLLKGGLDQGQWLMCFDPGQAIYGETKFRELVPQATVLRLESNCRNTFKIAQEASHVSRIDCHQGARAQGSPVRHIWYKDQPDQAKQVTKFIQELLEDGLLPSDIVILSPKVQSLAAFGLDSSLLLYKLDPASVANRPTDKIGYTTIHAFKGLESKVVILTDIEDLDKRERLNYVGFTRARSLLVVSVKKDQKQGYLARLKGVIRRGQ